jgi:hypothetical protein
MTHIGLRVGWHVPILNPEASNRSSNCCFDLSFPFICDATKTLNGVFDRIPEPKLKQDPMVSETADPVV